MKSYISKFTIILLALFSFQSCKKEDLNKSNASQSYQQINSDPEDVLLPDRIRQIGDKIGRGKHHVPLAVNKSTVALADAVGGALVAGTVSWTGFGAIFAPYATAWGAFWVSKSVADLDGGTIAMVTNPTVPNVLEYDYIGETHNLVMYDCQTAGDGPNIVEGALNSTITGKLLSADYSLYPTATPTELEDGYNDISNHIISTMNYSQSILNNGYTELTSMIDNSTFSADVKNSLNEIIEYIATEALTPTDVTNYLELVENAVNASELTTNNKNRIKYFLAITHHSYYYWNANLE